MISKPSPTASRTARSRATSSLTCGLPTLIFAPLKPACCAASVSRTSVVGRQVQPAALGGVHRDALLGAAGGAPQRLAVAPAAPVPQRGVDRGQRQAGDRADAGGVGGEQQVAPDRLDQRRVAADQARARWSLQQRHHRRAAGADGVAVAGAARAVVACGAHDRRLLRHERLDRVAARHRRRQVDLQQLDAAMRVIAVALRYGTRPRSARAS